VLVAGPILDDLQVLHFAFCRAVCVVVFVEFNDDHQSPRPQEIQVWPCHRVARSDRLVVVEGLQLLRADTQHPRKEGNQVAEDQMLPADGFTPVAPGCNIVARPAEALAAVPVGCMWGLCWVVVGVVLAPGAPAVRDAVDGLAPLAVAFSRIEAPLLLAPGTPAVRDAVDGLAPLPSPKAVVRHPSFWHRVPPPCAVQWMASPPLPSPQIVVSIG
jgi:hypothetical protein